MANINCPKCGRKLRLPPIEKTRGVRCPACEHVFAVSPPKQRSSTPGDYDGEGVGTFTKVVLTTLAALAVAFIAILIYAAAIGPSPPNESPQPLSVAVPDTRLVAGPAVSPTKSPSSTPGQTEVQDGTYKDTPADSEGSETVVLLPEKLFEKFSPAVVHIVVRDKNFRSTGHGSGFFIDPKGLLVTNHHVIQGAEFATAILSDGTTLFVDGVTAVDPDADLALLKVSGEGFPYLKAAEDSLPKIGIKVYAIGNPRGLTNTFSVGMVSGHRKVAEDLTVIQTIAPISQGSSGGPLLDAGGRVVGVHDRLSPQRPESQLRRAHSAGPGTPREAGQGEGLGQRGRSAAGQKGVGGAGQGLVGHGEKGLEL